jgi:hypothetical protein
MDFNSPSFHIMEHLDQVPWIARFVCSFVFLVLPVGGGYLLLSGIPGDNAAQKLINFILAMVMLAIVCGIGVMHWG